MSDLRDLPPIMCSQGGFAYNGEHIEYWKARAAKAADEIASLRADRDKWHKVAMDAGAITCSDGGHIFPRRDEIASLRAQLASGKAYDDLREQHIAKLEAQLASARKALEEIKSKGTTTGYGRTALARIAAMTLSSLTDEKGKEEQ